MANTVLVQTQVAAMNVDAYNIDAICTTANLMNGSVFQRSALSTTAGQGELFTAIQPAADAGLKNLWMAYSPEIVNIVTASGLQFRGLSIDPRDFTNLQNVPFTAYKPQVGDLITMTGDGIVGGLSALTKDQFAVATAGSWQLSPNASAIAGLSYQVRNTNSYITIANAQGASQRVPAVLLECVAVE